MTQYYSELAKPKGFTKIGLRYINEIELPPVPLEMRDYFKLYASVPPELGSTHGRFMLRMEMTPLHGGHQLLVSLVSKEVGPQGPSRFMFDLYDIFPCERSLPLDSLMGIVKDAHENPVLAFENSLTQKTKDLFEEEK